MSSDQLKHIDNFSYPKKNLNSKKEKKEMEVKAIIRQCDVMSLGPTNITFSQKLMSSCVIDIVIIVVIWILHYIKGL